MTAHKPRTERARQQFSHAQHVAAPPEAVFPLLCPVREYDWIPEWDCRLVYTASGVAEPGCVFQTDRPADGGLDTWVISRHEPPARVGFVRINPLRAMQYDIRLEPADGNSTVLTWEQVITSLCDEGDRHVAALRETDFVQSITGMEALLNRYLKEENTPEAGD